MGRKAGALALLQALLVEPGKVVLAETGTPRPGKGELLVGIKAALSCGTDLKAFVRGHPMIPMPGPFGHEFSGVAAGVGKGVKGFKEGDEIMSVHSAPCLRCGYCKKKLHNLCEEIMGSKVMGAFAEYILLPSHIVRQNAFRKPKKLSFEEAAFLEPLACVAHGVEPLEIRRGEAALVIGAGPIGLLHAMLIKHKGALVAAVDINAARLAKAKLLGADLVVDASRDDIAGALSELTPGGMGFDYVFECTGRPEVWESSAAYLRRGGTLVLFGGCPPGKRVAFDTQRLHYDEITLRGSFHYTPEDVRRAYGLLAGGKLDVRKLISGRYGLRNLKKAFDDLAEGRGIKYAVVP